MKMNANKERLVGELIGLARATDGNEHLINPSATALIVQVLSLPTDADPENIELLMNRITDEKRKMVPDCFLCANPCGRTGGYDFQKLKREVPEIRQLKLEILKLAENISAQVDPISGDAAFFLYKALIVTGIEGYSADDLKQIAEEGKQYL